MKQALLIKSASGYRRLKPRVINRSRNGFYATVKGEEVMLKKQNDLFIVVDSRSEKVPKITFCMVCGRVLTNEHSVEEGIGPICSGEGH